MWYLNFFITSLFHELLSLCLTEMSIAFAQVVNNIGPVVRHVCMFLMYSYMYTAFSNFERPFVCVLDYVFSLSAAFRPQLTVSLFLCAFVPSFSVSFSCIAYIRNFFIASICIAFLSFLIFFLCFCLSSFDVRPNPNMYVYEKKGRVEVWITRLCLLLFYKFLCYRLRHSSLHSDALYKIVARHSVRDSLFCSSTFANTKRFRLHRVECEWRWNFKWILSCLLLYCLSLHIFRFIYTK